MANNAGTKDKLRKEIQSLELDDIAVEKGVRKGLLSFDEGKKRKAEIDTKRGKISKELQQELATDQPHDEKKHADDKHEKKSPVVRAQIKTEIDNISPSSSATTEATNTVSTQQPTTSTQETVTPASPSAASSNTTSSSTSSSQNNTDALPPPPIKTSATYNAPTPNVLPLSTQSTASTNIDTSLSSASLAAETTQTTQFTQQPPTPIAKRTILKAMGRAATQKIGNVYKYTPLGFLVGQVDLGDKEREFAKTTTKNILSAPKTLTMASTNAAKTGAATALRYTPGGLLWEHLVPEKIKTNIRSALHSGFIKDPPLTFDMKGLGTGSKKAVDKYSALYKYTPLGLIWKNFLPKSTQDALGNLAKNANGVTQAKLRETKTNQTQAVKSLSKSVFGKYSDVYKKYTPLGILYKAVPEKKKQDALKTLKSAKEYQKIWNKNIVTSALKKGYDRFGLLQKIRNAKIWKSTAFKYGKYTVSPLGAAMYDRKQYLKKQDQKTQSGQTSSSSKLQTALRGKNPYAEWTSPKSLSNKFWNSAWNRFGTPSTGNVNRALGRKIGNKAGRKAANKIGQQLGKKAAQTIVQSGMRAILLNPGTLTAIGIVLLVLVAVVTLLIIIASITGSGDSGNRNGNDEENGGTPITSPIPGMTLSLTGPPSINTCENTSAPECVIEYTITYSYSSSAVPLESITIHNNIPPSTVFESATGDYKQEGTRISWPLNRVNNQTTLTFKIRPTTNNIRVTNSVFANTTFTGGSGNLSAILPPSIESSEAVDAAQQQVVSQVAAAPELIAAYQTAERATGVPWQLLAGIHYQEGSLNPNNSLVSGRPIGGNEPDIERGGGCSSTYVEGEPIALPGGGCGFRTFTDSVIYAANHFKSKNGGTVPASFEDLAKSLSYYNGGGNANCGKTPYAFCPHRFIGDDDTYVMNFFDKNHVPMYRVYCLDFTLCNPPYQDQRPGVASVIMGLNRFYNTTQQ